MRRDAPAGPDQAAKRAGVCWLRPAGTDDATPARLVWHAWYDGAVLVLSDADQPLDAVIAAGRAEVVLRARGGDVRGASWTAEVEVVAPDDPRWPACAGALLAARLNLPDPEAARQRWRRTAQVLRITSLDR